jgi:hypothetical protein
MMLGPDLQQGVIHVRCDLFAGYSAGTFLFTVTNAQGEHLGVLSLPRQGGKRAAFAASREYFTRKFLENARFLPIGVVRIYRVSGVLECDLIDKKRVNPALLPVLQSFERLEISADLSGCPWAN